MGQTIFNGPTTHLGAVQLEGVQSQSLRGSEAVRARRGASQTLSEQIGDRLGPGRGVIPTRSSRDPKLLVLSRSGAKVIGGERIEAAAGEVELFGRFAGRQRMFSEAIEHMANERRSLSI